MIAVAIPLLAAALALPAEPVVVAPDPAAAERAAIVGATNAERAAARGALAAVPDVPVVRVAFFEQGRTHARGVRIVLRGARDDVLIADRWLASFLGEDIARRLAASGHTLRWISLQPGSLGGAVRADAWPVRTEVELVALARSLAERATAAGLVVSGLRVWPTGPGAVEVVIRLTEQQVLAGAGNVHGTVGPTEVWARVALEAPDGTTLDWDGAEALERTDLPPPADLVGPTRIDADLQRQDVATQHAIHHRIVLDCDGGPSVGVPDVPATCAQLLGGRYGLFPADTACSPAEFADSLHVRGTVLGVPVERTFDGCVATSVGRWSQLLRVPAVPYADAGDLPGNVRVPTPGATAAERRAALASLAAVPGVLDVRQVRFRTAGSLRTIRVDARGPRYSALSAADVHWLADQVRQDIVDRLRHVRPVESRRALLQRLRTRTRGLAGRAAGAGWYVRLASGWDLRRGAYLVTIRLTERQFLDGRIDWERVIAGPRPRRDAVRVAVEAPDGTLVAGGGMPFPRGEAPPPPGIEGPTRLELDVELGERGHRSAVLDCDGPGSLGIADVPVACAQLIADRYALLAPERTGCGSSGAAHSVRVTGTFRGVPIQRGYGACLWRVVARWESLLAPSPATRELADAPADPVVVAPDPAAAERAAIVGATNAERAAARTALAAVPDAPLQRLAFTGPAGKRELRMTVEPAAHARGADPRGAWLPWVVAGLVRRTLVASGGGLWSAWDGRMGAGLAPDDRPDRSADDLVADARAAAERAAVAGWAVSSVRVWPSGPGAVELRLRLSERQLLDGRTDWLSVIFPGPISFTHLLAVEAPDGTVLTYADTITATAGGVAYSTAAPEGEAPPPDDPSGATRLVMRVERQGWRAPYRTQTRRYVLDCAGGRSTRIDDVPATCDRLVRDRYALLTPQASDTACSGAPGGDEVAITGTAFGVPISRGYEVCYAEAAQRWVEVLRVPARGRVLPRLLGPAYGTVTGGTARERRAARHAMAAAAADLPAINTIFRRHGGRRVTIVEPGAIPDGSDLSAADADWLAERVKQDLAQRLQGNAPPAPGVLAVEARLATLAARATAAGWYVRVARAWPLRNGPYLVTIRLTERQLLDGRIDWERVIAGPRPRRDAVRVAVEAPDGTLVAGGGMPFPRGEAPPPPGIDGPTRLTIDVGFGLGGSRQYVLDCDGGRSRGIADVAAVCARLVSDRYALLAPERDRCVAFGTTPSVHLTGTFRGVTIQRRQACVWQVVARWRTLLGATAPALDPPTSP